MSDQSDSLEKLEARLAVMSTKNDTLRLAIDALTTTLAETSHRHKEEAADARRAMERMTAEHAAEQKQLQADIAAATSRREEVKKDYGELYESVGLLKKAAEQAVEPS